MKKIISAGFLAAVAVVLSTASGSGQAPGALATLSGSVTAGTGAVRAVRVKATDPVHRIAYTVFTKNGQYRIFNLPPGTYQVAALQAGFDSTTETVELTAGAAGQAHVALTTRQEKPVKVVDFDELYPPGPARDLLMKECAGCHSFAHIPWHKMGPRSEDAWRASVAKMFNITPPNPVPRVAPGVVSEEGKALVTKYFNDNFGQDSVPREFKRDPLPLDEDALAQAIYVQYELPPPGKNAAGQAIAARRMHDVYPSQVSRNVWIVDTQTGAILGMDTAVADYQKRFREWLLPSPTRFSVFPHGIVESQGRVYFTELQNSALGELDPETGEVTEHQTPEKGLPHTPRMDSKGNIWFSKLYNNSRVDMLDVKTRKVLEWDPAPDLKNANYYGLTVDKQDRVWAVAMTAASIVGYDPKTDKWTRYPTPTPMSGPRRPTVAPDGRVWFSENTGDAIGVLDPKTGKITEYKSPVRHGGEYECFSDAQGNIWVSLRAYDTLARFNPKDAKFTYYPYPNLTGFVPKIETDPQGTIWFGIGTTLASFRANGNVPTRQTAAR